MINSNKKSAFIMGVNILFVVSMILSILALAKEDISPETKEAKIKSAMIYQIIKLIYWPDSKQTISFCVIGDSGYLGDEFLRMNRKISNGRQLSVTRRELDSPIDKLCDSIIVQDKKLIAEVLQKIKDKPILSISDDINFVEKGGIIELYRKGKRIKFLLNKEAIPKTKLNVDDKLMKLSK